MKGLIFEFQVTVSDHQGKKATFFTCGAASVVDLKLANVWNGGSEGHPPATFTLSFQGKTLHDNMTLNDIYTSTNCSDGKLELKIDSFDIRLRQIGSRRIRYHRIRVDDPNLSGNIAASLYPSNGVDLQGVKFWCNSDPSLELMPYVPDVISLKPMCLIVYGTKS